MQTLTDIKSLLASRGLAPKYRLGQNFLHDSNQMAKIIDAAHITAGDVVLEVGAGSGALSEHILDAGAKLVAVEIDTDLQPILEERLNKYSENVKFIFEDVLDGKHKINPNVTSAIGGRQFTLVANLPYATASPLLANLALDAKNMVRSVVMVQKEVANRLLAAPGNKTYGPLGILIQTLCEVEKISTLRPSCFWPQPKVDSTVVALLRRNTALVDDPHGFAKFLHKIFSRRRKQIKAILNTDIAKAANIDPKARPETLSIKQLGDLFTESCTQEFDG